MKIWLPLDSFALAMGGEEVAGAILAEAGKRGVAVSLTRNGSRGMAWLEPLVEVEVSGVRHAFGPMQPADVPALFDDLAAHPKALGPTEDLDWMKGQTRLTFARVGVTDPLSLAEYRAHGGLAGLDRALTMQKAQIVQEVTDSGLRGRGGAGFPTGIKWKTVSEASADRKYIVCNADEGDSATFADRMLMEGDPFCLIEGMAIAGLATGATKGFVYIRSEYPVAIRIMRRAVDIAREAGILGAAFDMEIRVGAGAYVCGEETSLLNSLEGKRGVVRAKPPLPALEGFMGRPTVVNNVISLASVPVILAKGAAYYKDFGLGRSRGTIPLQIAGNVKYGGLYETAFGLTLGQIVDEIARRDCFTDRPVKAVQVGGPLGAYFPPSLFDTPFGYEEFAAQGRADRPCRADHRLTTAPTCWPWPASRWSSAPSNPAANAPPAASVAVRGVETLDRIGRGDSGAMPLI
jgi:formate dehydrogenase iron-sulfur subunit